MDSKEDGSAGAIVGVTLTLFSLLLLVLIFVLWRQKKKSILKEEHKDQNSFNTTTLQETHPKPILYSPSDGIVTDKSFEKFQYDYDSYEHSSAPIHDHVDENVSWYHAMNPANVPTVPVLSTPRSLTSSYFNTPSSNDVDLDPRFSLASSFQSDQSYAI